MKKKTEAIISFLQARFPDAKCALNFANPYQCLCAVMLSAQTTDASVNKVTPALFSSFPDPKSLANARLEEIETIIRSIGLYHNKAKNLIEMAKAIESQYGGEVPSSKEDLVRLPGVGIKTANVVGAECFDIPAIAVDTHVHRIACRLGYSSEKEDPVKVEKILEKEFPKELHMRLHHQLIWFGRMICHAKKPDCPQCGLSSFCPYFKKNFSTKGK